MTADLLTHAEREAWAQAVIDVTELLRRAEADRDTLLDALAPFAAYYAWRIAKGLKTSPPPLGPKELEQAYEAVRSHTGKDPA